QLRTSRLDERFEMSAFLNKTVLLAPDVKPDFLQRYGASLLKVLTGGDYLQAEMKGANERQSLEGVFCPVITSNSRLHARIEGDAEAWRRRLLRVWFASASKAQRIRDYHKLLVSEEGPGLLNFGLTGAQLLLHDLKETGVIELTGEQRLRVDRFVDESQSLRI